MIKRGGSSELMSSTGGLSVELENLPENQDVVIAGGFQGVRVFMTDQTYNGK